MSDSRVWECPKCKGSLCWVGGDEDAFYVLILSHKQLCGFEIETVEPESAIPALLLEYVEDFPSP